MTNANQQLTSQDRFAESVHFGCKIIGYSFPVISRLFKHNELCIIKYPYGKFNKVMEIRFEVLTLSCLFDENDICNSSFLFLDSLEDLKYYINYCDKMYVYNLELHAWMIESYCMRINPYRDDYFFSLSPVIRN